jgi:hypothetical protein
VKRGMLDDRILHLCDEDQRDALAVEHRDDSLAAEGKRGQRRILAMPDVCVVDRSAG